MDFPWSEHGPAWHLVAQRAEGRMGSWRRLLEEMNVEVLAGRCCPDWDGGEG